MNITDKVLKVISSCKTPNQVDASHRYLMLAHENGYISGLTREFMFKYHIKPKMKSLLENNNELYCNK